MVQSSHHLRMQSIWNHLVKTSQDIKSSSSVYFCKWVFCQSFCLSVCLFIGLECLSSYRCRIWHEGSQGGAAFFFHVGTPATILNQDGQPKYDFACFFAIGSAASWGITTKRRLCLDTRHHFESKWQTKVILVKHGLPPQIDFSMGQIGVGACVALKLSNYTIHLKINALFWGWLLES